MSLGVRAHRSGGGGIDRKGIGGIDRKGIGSVSLRKQRDCFAHVLCNKPSLPGMAAPFRSRQVMQPKQKIVFAGGATSFATNKYWICCWSCTEAELWTAGG